MCRLAGADKVVIGDGGPRLRAIVVICVGPEEVVICQFGALALAVDRLVI